MTDRLVQLVDDDGRSRVMRESEIEAAVKAQQQIVVDAIFDENAPGRALMRFLKERSKGNRHMACKTKKGKKPMPKKGKGKKKGKMGYALLFVALLGMGGCSALPTYTSGIVRELQTEIVDLRAQVEAEQGKPEPDAVRIAELEAQIKAYQTIQDTARTAENVAGFDWDNFLSELPKDGVWAGLVLAAVRFWRGSTTSRKGTPPRGETPA